jgi:hypothetical protein
MKALRSPKLASILVTLTALVALGTSGCYLQIGENSPGSTPAASVTPPPSPPAEAATPSSTATPSAPPAEADPASHVGIDPGATVSASPGKSVGVYVEDTGNGHWNVFTTCDTSVSGATCSFDLNVTPEAGSAFSGIAPENLASPDAMTVLEGGTVQMTTGTRYLENGLSFHTEPGAFIEINVLLDGRPQTGLVHWVSGGVVQDGVPSNPVDFVPAAP